jgi:hypothetical protein
MAINCKVFSHSEIKFKLGWQEECEESNKKEKKKIKKNQNLYHWFYIIQLKYFKLFNILGSCS